MQFSPIRVLAALASFLPLYASLLGVASSLTPEAHRLLFHEYTVGALAFGSAFSATGNSTAALVAVVLGYLALTELRAKGVDVQKFFPMHPENHDSDPSWTTMGAGAPFEETATTEGERAGAEEAGRADDDAEGGDMPRTAEYHLTA